MIDISGNLPTVRITDLVFHFTNRAKDNLVDGQIYVSTYGRGVWTIDLEDVRTWLAQHPFG